MEEWDTSNYKMEEKQDVDSQVNISALTSQLRLMKAYLADSPGAEAPVILVEDSLLGGISVH